MKMQINNFKSLLAHNNSDQQFIITEDFFIFQRKILFDVYGDFAGQSHAFRIYLYLCRHVDKRFRKCIKTRQDINIELKYKQSLPPGVTKLPNYSKVVDNALDWLERNYFIQRTSGHRQPYQVKILVAPDYHPVKKSYHSCADIKLSSGGLKNSNTGYIMVPNASVENDILNNKPSTRQKWPIRRLKTLLLLHGHCWLEYFGGIDPHIVSIDEQNETIELDEGFCYNVKGSINDITDTVLELIYEGLFIPVKCLFANDIYFGDAGQCNPPQNAKVEEKIILRPKHLVKKPVHAKTMKIKWGRMLP